MASLCKATIIGNLGRDPEKRFTQDGKPITRFSVAATTRKRDPSGEWQDHTEWFSVTVFGRLAETLGDRLTKGTRVYVEGRLESRSYQGAKGPGFSMDIIANEVISLEARARGDGEFGTGDAYDLAPAGRPSGAGQAAEAEDPQDLEDLPF